MSYDCAYERMHLNICHYTKKKGVVPLPLPLKPLPSYRSEKAMHKSLPKRTRTRFEEQLCTNNEIQNLISVCNGKFSYLKTICEKSC